VARELTKLHEEVWRGTLADAADALETGTARGALDHQDVLAPATLDDVDDATLLGDLRAELVSGASRRDAVDAVARARAVARNRVYELALTIRNP
jgi:16S rRNA (cytidine1402-2'-O)-methyltransferase